MLDNVMVFEMTVSFVIPNPVPNPSAWLRACPERSVGINSCEGACEESNWFQGFTKPRISPP